MKPEDTIESYIDHYTTENGFTESAIKGVRLFRTDVPAARRPFTGSTCICFGIKGSVTCYYSGNQFHYKSGNYMVVSMPMPIEWEMFTDEGEVSYAIVIDIDFIILQQILGRMDKCKSTPPKEVIESNLRPAALNKDMKATLLRLLRCLDSPAKVKILAPGILKEIFYNVLCGSKSSNLCNLANHNTPITRVAKALNYVNEHTNKPITVKMLAQEAGMSVSAFHTEFKKITAESPIQYVKKMRLNKAELLLKQGKISANTVAQYVGYKSASQFSREFKQLFGVSPMGRLNKSWLMEKNL
ncbi:MAG: AraC family transcriptional regulator [Rickettsiales bacterium]|nr:MAG: AraC family transcriptional regulator [Rickettsiales bacterium]